jgi:hypothetical protein
MTKIKVLQYEDADDGPGELTGTAVGQAKGVDKRGVAATHQFLMMIGHSVARGN